MAKKRKRRTSTTRPPTAVGPKGSRTGTPEAPTVRPAPAGPGAPSRQVRKEEARRERERLRRRAARRRMVRRALRVGAVVAVLAGIGVGVWFLSRPKGLSDEQRDLLARAEQAAQAAGCTEVREVQPYPGDPTMDRTHVDTLPPLSSYRTQPPASGPHFGSTLAAGVYTTPPVLGQAIHSLEHGAAIIWYDPERADPQELARIQTFFDQAGNRDHVIVAPYDYPDEGEAGRLPEGTAMALTAWHRMQTCRQVSLPVAFSFVFNYASTPYSDYKGEAPEAGVPI
jgi:hypothetical protein